MADRHGIQFHSSSTVTAHVTDDPTGDKVDVSFDAIPSSDDDSGYAVALVPTAVKTANYVAVAGDFVPVDTTAGAVTITLPAAPANRTRIAIKLVIQGGTNAVTINRGGADVFNKAGGSTSLTLSLLFQAVSLQYASGIWYVVSDDLPLGDLDARYVAPARQIISGAGLTGGGDLSADRTLSVLFALAAAAGPPTAGAHAKGELWFGSGGDLWVCTVAGTPGTWASVGGAQFGDGSDGDFTADGIAVPGWATLAGTVYTVTRIPYLRNLTINAGIRIYTQGYPIFVAGVLATDPAPPAAGSISNAGNVAVGAAGGGSGAVGGNWTQSASSGGNGATGAGVAGGNLANTVPSVGAAGGAGGAGGTGAAGAAGGRFDPKGGVPRYPAPYRMGIAIQANGGAARMAGGSGGGGGGGDGTNSGGGGGGGGQVVIVIARVLNNQGVITADGGAGANGVAGNAGGGGGGGGGAAIVVTHAIVNQGTVRANGGVHGNGVGTGTNGTDGAAGTALVLSE